ncbi:unnamed protein product [Prunus armeniaca]|uniref:Uncharacterized protein n=1 Tax=Prunus armeniaca TaxID=36596 RepID=A0A6J5XXS5_PRUAR|nr:unnamed protein product [Prunus armeniaca]
MGRASILKAGCAQQFPWSISWLLHSSLLCPATYSSAQPSFICPAQPILSGRTKLCPVTFGPQLEQISAALNSKQNPATVFQSCPAMNSSNPGRAQQKNPYALPSIAHPNSSSPVAPNRAQLPNCAQLPIHHARPHIQFHSSCLAASRMPSFFGSCPVKKPWPQPQSPAPFRTKPSCDLRQLFSLAVFSLFPSNIPCLD